jgi:hypothetical protein
MCHCLWTNTVHAAKMTQILLVLGGLDMMGPEANKAKMQQMIRCSYHQGGREGKERVDKIKLASCITLLHLALSCHH